MEYNTPIGQSTCRYKGERNGRHINKEGGKRLDHDKNYRIVPKSVVARKIEEENIRK